MKITKARSQELRAQILMSAAEEIRQVGFASMTFAKVAADCDVTASAITNRFRNKFELVEALLEEIVAPAIDANVHGSVVEFWEGVPPSTDVDPLQIGLVAELLLASVHSPELSAIAGAFMLRLSESNAPLRLAAIEAGLVREGQNPLAQSTIALASMIGHYVSGLVSPPPPGLGAQILRLTQMSILEIPFDTTLPPVPLTPARPLVELPHSDAELDAVGSSLIEAARTVFTEHGYEKGSLQDIARVAGRTTGSIYSRFSGKADLMRALVLASIGPNSMRTMNVTLELADSFDTQKEALGNYIARLNQPAFAQERALRLVARDAARREPLIAEVVGPLQDLHLHILTETFRLRQEAGLLRPDLSVAALAWWMVSLPVGTNLLGDLYPATRANDWESIFDVTNRAIHTFPRSAG